jgi:hypothetical protein
MQTASSLPETGGDSDCPGYYSWRLMPGQYYVSASRADAPSDYGGVWFVVSITGQEKEGAGAWYYLLSSAGSLSKNVLAESEVQLVRR